MDLRLSAGRFVLDEAGDARLVDGADRVVQDIVHELETPLGGLRLHPTYGAALQRFYHLESLPVHHIDLVATIRECITRNPAVDPESVVAEIAGFERDGLTVGVAFTVRAEGAARDRDVILRLTIGANGVSVEGKTP